MRYSRKTKNGNEIYLIENDVHRNSNILVIGVFHGEEPQGKFLIENYMKENPKSPLLFIPCLNPDGMAIGQRENANGIDLNRNFNDKTETETKFIIDMMEKFKPKIVLSLHAPFKIVNYDGPAKEIAEKISSIIKYPVQADIGYPTPGSFGTWAGVEQNIPVITLELDENVELYKLTAPINEILDYLTTLI